MAYVHTARLSDDLREVKEEVLEQLLQVNKTSSSSKDIVALDLVEGFAEHSHTEICSLCSAVPCASALQREGPHFREASRGFEPVDFRAVRDVVGEPAVEADKEAGEGAYD